MRAQRADSPQYVWPLGKRTGDHEGRLGSLRVKCTLVDRQQLYPTSANLTDFAVSLNMELGLPFRADAAGVARPGAQLVDWRGLLSRNALRPSKKWRNHSDELF